MLVLGDAHADRPERRAALERAYAISGADRALQVGDLLAYDLPVPTWFAAGNNEDFDVIDALRAGEHPPGTENVTLLASTVVDLDGLRVAGLSGNHAPTQFEKSRADLSGDRRRHFTHEDVERLSEVEDVDVLLTHEAPHGLLMTEGYDPGCNHVDTLLREVDPELCLVGHHHTHAEGTFGDTRVVSLDPAWQAYYLLDEESLTLERHESPAE